MTTKTDKTAFAPLQHEADVIAKIESEREAILSLHVSLTPARDAMDDAEGDQVEVEGRIERGDETVTPEDLVSAEFAYKFAKLRFDGVEQRVKRIKNKPLPSTDKELAEAIAPLVGKAMLDRVPVHATVKLPDPASIPAEHLPIIYVASDGRDDTRYKGGSTMTNGMLRGGLDIMMVRDVMGRVLDPAHVAKAVLDAGLTHDGEESIHTAAGSVEGVEVDRGHIVLTRAWDTARMPTIDKPDANLNMAFAIAGIGADGKGVGRKVEREDRGFSGPYFTATDIGSKVVTEVLDSPGVRLTTTEATVSVQQVSRSLTDDALRMRTRILESAGSVDKSFAPGLGMVESNRRQVQRQWSLADLHGHRDGQVPHPCEGQVQRPRSRVALAQLAGESICRGVHLRAPR